MSQSRNAWIVPGALLAVLLLAIIAVSVASGYTGRAQTVTPTQPASGLPRTITVVGEGKVTIKPDVARSQIGVEVVKSTVQEASTEAQDVMEAVLDALKAAGVAEKDIQTSGYNIWVERRPAPEGKTQDEVLYHVTNQVQVVIRDLDSVGEVLDAAIEAGANNIYGVTFGLDNTTKVKSEARAKAIADGQAKAEELATLNNVELGEIVQVSEVIGSGGGFYTGFSENVAAARGVGGGGAGPISPGELELGMTLQLVYALQ
jgi:hypothetical protein